MTLKEAIELGRNLIHGPLPRSDDPVPSATEALAAVEERLRTCGHVWLTGEAARKVLQAHIEKPAADTRPTPAPAPIGTKSGTLSRAQRQYQQFKAQYPGFVLFFRMGDFYELFWDDAKLARQVLGIPLTMRPGSDEQIPIAGVPYHALETSLKKLIAAGHKAAVCEQATDRNNLPKTNAALNLPPVKLAKRRPNR